MEKIVGEVSCAYVSCDKLKVDRILDDNVAVASVVIEDNGFRASVGLTKDDLEQLLKLLYEVLDA